MPIIKCYECSGKLSNRANSCPHCGAPIFSFKTPNKTLGKHNSHLKLLVKKSLAILLILFGVGISLGIAVGSEGESNYSASEDFITCLLIGFLPIYLGFKLYNQTDILIIFNNWLKKLFKG